MTIRQRYIARVEEAFRDDLLEIYDSYSTEFKITYDEFVEYAYDSGIFRFWEIPFVRTDPSLKAQEDMARGKGFDLLFVLLASKKDFIEYVKKMIDLEANISNELFIVLPKLRLRQLNEFLNERFDKKM